MMHKFSKTGEYAKKRLKIALAEDRNTISSSDNMAQIKKEITVVFPTPPFPEVKTIASLTKINLLVCSGI
jgi:hypothetical protein